MSNNKKITLTIHGTQELKTRFKKVYGRWKEHQLDIDNSKTPTQKDFVNTMLDLIAVELGVNL